MLTVVATVLFSSTWYSTLQSSPHAELGPGRSLLASAGSTGANYSTANLAACLTNNNAIDDSDQWCQDCIEDSHNTETMCSELRRCELRHSQMHPPLFDAYTMRAGGYGLHIFIMLYLFAGMAAVCDDYLEDALDAICKNLGISEDVAGATFMAVGSSAPELFISVMAVFFSVSDTGVGTIVGSAVFNILIIIGLCSFVASGVVLNWYPLTRDTLFYSSSVLVLVFTIFDFKVMWFESTACIVLYISYIVWMKFNVRLEKKIQKWAAESLAATRSPFRTMLGNLYEGLAFNIFIGIVILLNMVAIIVESTDSLGPLAEWASITNHVCMGIFLAEIFLKIHAFGFCPYWRSPSNALDGVLGVLMVIDFSISQVSYQMTGDASSGAVQSGLRAVRMVRFLRLLRGLRCLRLVTTGAKAIRHINSVHEGTAGVSNIPASPALPGRSKDADGGELAKLGTAPNAGADDGALDSVPLTDVGAAQSEGENDDDDDDDDEDPNPFEVPSGIPSKMFWLLLLPLNVAMWATVFKAGVCFGKRAYMWNFVMCVIWIMLFSFLVDWMAAAIGCTAGIPDAAMGILFLAAGTSIPDTIASVNVAKKGMGDMAVSNSLGSNVFDILVGLGFPWLLKAMIYPDEEIKIKSKSLNINVMFLFITVALVVLSIHASNWKLSKSVGGAITGAYVIVISIMLMLELSVIDF